MIGLAMLGTAACDSIREFWVPGEVKDGNGQPISGCAVELILQRRVSDTWTIVRTRQTTTDSEGRFHLGVIGGVENHYRLRVTHGGYAEWAVDGRWPTTTMHYHVTLSREESPMSGPRS